MAEELTPPVVAQYPSLYTFRVVVREEAEVRARVRAIIHSVVGTPVPEDAIIERPSAQGKYVSLHVSCVLESEDQRRDVYVKLRAEEFVKFML